MRPTRGPEFFDIMANQILNEPTKELIRAGRTDGMLFFLPPGQLPRPAYEAVKKALMTAGGKWNTPKQAFVFPGEAAPHIEAMVATGKVEDVKKKFQSFYTPPDLARRMVEALGVKGLRTLEPSAGEGAIADALDRAKADQIFCVEIRPEACAILRKKLYSTHEGDFLALAIERSRSKAERY